MNSRGFTLIEMLLVVAILGILIVVGFPHMEQLTQRSQSVVCMSNLRQLGTMAASYLNDHDGQYPKVETNPSYPEYQGETVPGMADTFSTYGLAPKCFGAPLI
ncbi:MAG: prepilin-type N-terminal cleavage/methylation domain-containing protein [Chthoniobacterales bacterium]